MIGGTQGVAVNESAAAGVILDYIENEYDGVTGKITIPTVVVEPIGSAEELAKVKEERKRKRLQ